MEMETASRRMAYVLTFLWAVSTLTSSACFGQDASILLESNVQDAAVLLDGQLRGRTDRNGMAFVDSLTTGRHTVQLRKSGYRAASTTVRLDAGLTQSVNLDLEETTQGTTEETTGRERSSTPTTENRSGRSFGGWHLLLAGLGGMLLGGVAGWVLLRERLKMLLDERARWKSRFLEEQAQNYRDAVTARPPAPSTPKPETTDASNEELRRTVEQLRETCEQLRSENESLREDLNEARQSGKQTPDESGSDEGDAFSTPT